MNPLVDEATRDALLATRPDMPWFPEKPGAEPGVFKVPAAWLIEQSGFSKGFTRGAVGLSSKHALAIVNRGGASAAEIVQFARIIRDGVRERFGVALVPEPELVGMEW
jgi:UDP-N-acetylmuramate dehydrogenase